MQIRTDAKRFANVALKSGLSPEGFPRHCWDFRFYLSNHSIFSPVAPLSFSDLSRPGRTRRRGEASCLPSSRGDNHYEEQVAWLEVLDKISGKIVGGGF
jgi:hypothetical protein